MTTATADAVKPTETRKLEVTVLATDDDQIDWFTKWLGREFLADRDRIHFTTTQSRNNTFNRAVKGQIDVLFCTTGGLADLAKDLKETCPSIQVVVVRSPIPEDGRKVLVIRKDLMTDGQLRKLVLPGQ